MPDLDTDNTNRTTLIEAAVGSKSITITSLAPY